MNTKLGKLKIIGASLAILLACAVVGVSLYAYLNNTLTWFASNHEVKANGMQTAAEVPEKIHVARMVVYKYEVSAERVVAKLDDPASPNYMVLNQYDTVFTERQQYTPMVIKVPLEWTKGEKFTIHFKCSGDLYNTEGKMDDMFSNVISIKCGMSNTLDNMPNTEKNDDTTGPFYEAAKKFFTETGKEVTGTGTDCIDQNEKYCVRKFVDDSGSDWTKDKEFTIDVGEHTVRRYEGLSEFDQANVYFYLDYDPALIKRFIDENITISAQFLSGDSVVFEKDITTITFGDEAD